MKYSTFFLNSQFYNKASILFNPFREKTTAFRSIWSFEHFEQNYSIKTWLKEKVVLHQFCSYSPMITNINFNIKINFNFNSNSKIKTLPELIKCKSIFVSFIKNVVDTIMKPNEGCVVYNVKRFSYQCEYRHRPRDCFYMLLHSMNVFSDGN